MNLAKVGECKYWPKCKYEHINLPYVWRVFKLVSGDLKDPKNSIANRILKSDTSEIIERAFSDPSNTVINIEYLILLNVLT